MNFDKQKQLATRTNIVYALADVLETNLMDLESAYRKEGFALRQDAKRQYNTAIHAIRRIKGDVDKCSADTQDMFGDDADILNALLLMMIDRCGNDDMFAFKLFNYIKAFPSRLGMNLDGLDKAFENVVK